MRKRAIGAIWTVVFLAVCPVVAAEELPPKITMDWHLLRAARLVAAEDPRAAFDTMRKVVVLQEEHGLTLPNRFHFEYARVALSAGAVQQAIDAVSRYLREASRPDEGLVFPIKAQVAAVPCGKTEVSSVAYQFVEQEDADLYRQALELLDEAKQVQSWIETRQTCAGQPRGAECWMEVSGQPGCHVWNPHFEPGETLTWAGKCHRGRAHGRGTLTRTWKGGKKAASIAIGTFQDGKKSGQWHEYLADGAYRRGIYLNGRKHDQWNERSADGTSRDGPYMNGKKHGRWSVRSAAGAYQEGLYVNGKRHGEWAERR